MDSTWEASVAEKRALFSKNETTQKTTSCSKPKDTIRPQLPANKPTAIDQSNKKKYAIQDAKKSSPPTKSATTKESQSILNMKSKFELINGYVSLKPTTKTVCDPISIETNKQEYTDEDDAVENSSNVQTKVSNLIEKLEFVHKTSATHIPQYAKPIPGQKPYQLTISPLKKQASNETVNSESSDQDGHNKISSDRTTDLPVKHTCDNKMISSSNVTTSSVPNESISSQTEVSKKHLIANKKPSMPNSSHLANTIGELQRRIKSVDINDGGKSPSNRGGPSDIDSSPERQLLTNCSQQRRISSHLYPKWRKRYLPLYEEIGPPPAKPPKLPSHIMASVLSNNQDVPPALPQRRPLMHLNNEFLRSKSSVPPPPSTMPKEIQKMIRKQYISTNSLSDKNNSQTIPCNDSESLIEEELYDDTVEHSSLSSTELYADVTVPDETDQLYEDISTYSGFSNGFDSIPYVNSKVADQNKREKYKKMKLEVKDKVELKKQKALEKQNKKFNLTGNELPVDMGIIKEDIKGKRCDLKAKKGDKIFILRIENNPIGKWLGKNEQGEVGYVDLANLEVDADSIRSVMSQSKSNLSSSGYDSYVPSSYSDNADIEEAIYEEFH